MFRVIKATISFDQKHWAPTRLREISKSRHAGAVREISIGIEPSNRPQLSQVREYVKDLDVVLLPCLLRLWRLAKLKVNGPEFDNSNTPAPLLPRDVMRLLTRTVGNALRSAPMLELKDLTISLPLTSDFARLMDRPFSGTMRCPTRIERILERLEHLDIEVSDNTGPFGQRYFNTATSPGKSARPIVEYAPDFFKFISLAKNLQSLQLRSSEVIDLDLLNIDPLQGLRIISLHGMKVSNSHLLKLIERCQNNSRRVELSRVDLMSGNWEDVLTRLSLVEHLEYFEIEFCGYSTSGKSARTKYPASIDKPQFIEGPRHDDYKGLTAVQRTVMARRDTLGVPQICGDQYSCAAELPDWHRMYANGKFCGIEKRSFCDCETPEPEPWELMTEGVFGRPRGWRGFQTPKFWGWHKANTNGPTYIPWEREMAWFT